IRTPDDAALVEELAVLAFVRAPGKPDHAWIRPSACLLLAQVSRNEPRQRWLRAVAAVLDDRYATVNPGGGPLDDFPASARLAAAEFIGLTLAGRGALARRKLDEPGVEGVLAAVSDAVVLGRPAPPVSRLVSEAGLWPCRQCSNAREVPDPADPESTIMLCPTCLGDPGPRLTAAERMTYVARDAMLLDAEGATWSTEHALMQTGPLQDPDPQAVPSTYGVDPKRTLFRNGQWVAPEPAAPRAG
ncbi:MAG: hypothetical protein AAFR96_13445, partial [Planctomycetota bacterium]